MKSMKVVSGLSDRVIGCAIEVRRTFSKCSYGLLINFNVPPLKNGIKCFLN